ncbi:MAG: hypothetical protein EOO45_24800 [Flavobacterium sp.]|nr:MAG: hypothetical protein EOO45_24800 [Flavobacterium sp.]
MKKAIGFIIILLSLAFIAIAILKIWGIEVVSLNDIIRGSATLILLGVAILILIIAYGAFFRNNSRDYDSKRGNRAHPKL